MAARREDARGRVQEVRDEAAVASSVRRLVFQVGEPEVRMAEAHRVKRRKRRELRVDVQPRSVHAVQHAMAALEQLRAAGRRRRIRGEELRTA